MGSTGTQKLVSDLAIIFIEVHIFSQLNYGDKMEDFRTTTEKKVC
jgi:hypothetical protein